MRGYLAKLIERNLTARRRLGLGMAAIVGLIALPMFTSPVARANDKRVVSIHVDDQTISFATDAATVSDALARRGINLGLHDLVEPAPDTPINTNPFHINVYRSRPVVVVDGDEHHRVVSAYQSPRLIAEQAGLKIYDEDEFKLERIENILSEGVVGLKLTIERATPLTLSLYGTASKIRTQAGTVGELLSERGLSVDEDDILRPSKKTLIESGMTISLIRVSDDTIVVEESIPFGTRQIVDTSQPVEYQQMRSNGVNGERIVTYKLTLEDGKEVSRKAVSSVVLKQPKDQVLVLGGAPVNLGNLAGKFAQLRGCEAGGTYERNSGNGFYGAYQFVPSTWRSNAPGGWKNVMPHEAIAAAQDKAALTLFRGQGWGPWPGCTKSFGWL